MNKIALDFIQKNRVCVLSGIMSDGGSHSSTVHFSFQLEPLKLFFKTWDQSMKSKSLLQGKDMRGSVVIGFDEKDKKTVQMRGALKIISHDMKEEVISIEFTPTWWRYSDLSAEPEVIIEG